MFKPVDFSSSVSKNHKIESIEAPQIGKAPRKALIEGGNIKFKGNETIKREIVVKTRFPISYRDKEIKFSNFIPKNIPHKIKCCCDALASDIEQIFTDNNVVHFSDNWQKERLCKILDYYLPDVSEANRKNRIFKFDATESSALHMESSSVRVYLYIENEPNISSRYNIIFCDPFHLAIPARHNGQAAKKAMEANYKKNSMNNTHIGEAFKKYDIFC